jgi:hypothetical protein
MALAAPTQVGSQIEQAAAPGTNATATVTSASRTWVADELIIAGCHMIENSGASWDFISLTASGGAITTPVIYNTTSFDNGGGYSGRAAIIVAKVTTGWTGTVSAARTAGSADHWTRAGFYFLTGQDLTTPVPQAKGTTVVAPGGGTSLAIALPGAPASTSLVFGCVEDGSSSAAFTPPTNFTEIAERVDANYGSGENAYDLASAATSNTWTGLNNDGMGGVVIEIAEASAGGTNVPLHILNPNIPFAHGYQGTR